MSLQNLNNMYVPFFITVFSQFEIFFLNSWNTSLFLSLNLRCVALKKLNKYKG